jgi:predicted nucleotidyltransferase
MKARLSLPSQDVAIFYHTLRRLAQARFREKERRRRRARRAVEEAISVVLPHYPAVRRVYLFGSVTRPGAFEAGSDIDIGVEGADMALCLDIWRDLERVVTEWLLDVRSLDRDDLFVERVRQKGEVVYDRSLSCPQVGHTG